MENCSNFAKEAGKLLAGDQLMFRNTRKCLLEFSNIVHDGLKNGHSMRKHVKVGLEYNSSYQKVKKDLDEFVKDLEVYVGIAQLYLGEDFDRSVHEIHESLLAIISGVNGHLKSILEKSIPSMKSYLKNINKGSAVEENIDNLCGELSYVERMLTGMFKDLLVLDNKDVVLYRLELGNEFFTENKEAIKKNLISRVCSNTSLKKYDIDVVVNLHENDRHVVDLNEKYELMTTNKQVLIFGIKWISLSVDVKLSESKLLRTLNPDKEGKKVPLDWFRYLSSEGYKKYWDLKQYCCFHSSIVYFYMDNKFGCNGGSTRETHQFDDIEGCVELIASEFAKVVSFYGKDLNK